MSLPSRRLLITGVSTRAAAASAVRAGFDVISIDAFADRDQDSNVDVRTLPDGFSHEAAANFALDPDCDAVVYLAGFENHPDAVTVLAGVPGRELWGNSPEVLRRVRDPEVLAAAFRRSGHSVPEVRTAAGDTRRWLLKPRARGGGHRVRDWDGGEVPPDCYLQEFVPGPVGAIVFVAAGGRAVTLGVSQQIVGDPAFGASGYQYCGSVLSSDLDPAVVRDACKLAETAAREFDLVGVNGIDFIGARGHAWPVEINPRWTASMELVEEAFGLSVFGVHAAACVRGELPESDERSVPAGEAFGKAILFAREEVRIPDTREWCGEGMSVRDVPRPGTRIPARRPICTVVARGQDGADCRVRLIREARRIYAGL